MCVTLISPGPVTTPIEPAAFWVGYRAASGAITSTISTSRRR